MSFANLKKQSSLGSLTSKLVKEVEKMSTKTGGDDRLWKPEMDKTGNGYAVIRFLPAPDGERSSLEQDVLHAFQGPSWYIENSLTTTGGRILSLSTTVNSGTVVTLTSEKLPVSKKRKLSYYANIYVVKDPTILRTRVVSSSTSSAKRSSTRSWKQCNLSLKTKNPSTPSTSGTGADFKLKIKKVAGYWNYDSSRFARPAALLDDDDALEAIWKKQYSLAEIVDASQFKTYDELDKRLKMVLGQRTSRPVIDEELEDESEGRGSFTPDFKSQAPEPVAETTDADEEDALSYFQNLANS